jgi:hypothetical protein
MDQPVPMLLSCGLLEYVSYTTVPTNPSVAGCQAVPAGTRRTSVQLFSYVPVAHCALAREMQKITNKTRKNRMPHTPRAFIHTDSKMGFGLFDVFIKNNYFTTFLPVHRPFSMQVFHILACFFFLAAFAISEDTFGSANMSLTLSTAFPALNFARERASCKTPVRCDIEGSRPRIQKL